MMKKDFDHDNPQNWKWGSIYFNKKDSRLIIRKRTEWMGWTFNFAHPASYLFMALILAYVLYKIYWLK
ncbi:DUF5808 domain-containing protein [Pedobacter agri]|uniref:DUF5808 domain-containing protein n=1 Tax=Pedobacter agri TaxID=454586 RepID=UPI00292D7F33|nr:DUF5808 domain-containing protein [Pedobacter agri]